MLRGAHEHRVGLAHDPRDVGGVVEMAVPDEDMGGLEKSELAGVGRHVAGVQAPGNPAVEQYDVPVDRGRVRHHARPRQDHAVLAHRARAVVDVLSAEELLSQRDRPRVELLGVPADSDGVRGGAASDDGEQRRCHGEAGETQRSSRDRGGFLGSTVWACFLRLAGMLSAPAPLCEAAGCLRDSWANSCRAVV